MRRSLALIFLAASVCSGYVRITTGETPSLPLSRVDNTQMQFYMNNLIVPGVTSSASGKAVTVISASSNPQVGARAAMATWQGISTANLSYLPLQTTTLGHDPTDGMMVIVIASTQDDVSAVGAALAITSVISAAGSGQDPLNPNLMVTDGSIIDTDILLNPGTTFSTDGSTTADFQAVLTHELGHSLGASHTGIFGATMFAYVGINARFPTTDDLAFVNSAYPPKTGALSFGTISGTITAAGAVPVPFALLTFVDTTNGYTVGGLAAADGTYSVQVLPGNYIVYAEPFNAIVQAGNLYLTAAQAALAVPFQPTLLGGIASPTSLAVTAGNTSTANISVTLGATAFKLPYYGFGGAGKSGDIGTFSSIVGPIQVPSLATTSSTIDVGFSGTGFVSTLTDANIKVFGSGISVVPGSVRPDTFSFNNQPIIRATLNIPARQSAGLASVFVSNGANSFAMTGFMVVVPPPPSFTTAGVVSAVSDLSGVAGSGTVSPGEYVTLYGTGVAPTTGPYFNIGYTNTGYVLGSLPTNLGGVSVTFDGIAAPIFFAGSGQINLQVPFEVSGKTSTKVVTSFYGSSSSAITVPVVPIHPALFSYSASAPGAFAANADGTFNTPSNPAARSSSSYLIVVGTGLGLPSYAGTAYPIQTGAAAPLPPAADQNANGWTCTLGGVSVPVLYSAWFAGFAAEAEWYVSVPATLTATGAVPIKITSPTGISTQSDLVVYLK